MQAARLPLQNYFGAREATILDTNFTNPHELKQNPVISDKS